jgi:DNA-binding CsgD family transcriptional regulator
LNASTLIALSEDFAQAFREFTWRIGRAAKPINDRRPSPRRSAIVYRWNAGERNKAKIGRAEGISRQAVLSHLREAAERGEVEL